ncbi:MAG: hypothetical protein ACOZEN_06250 [Thermodesulfobacteriota bacterium]
MTEQELAELAAAIPRASREAADAYASAAEALAAAVSARMLALGDIEQLTGLGNLRMMMDTHRRQARFLSAILADFDPALLVRTVLWAIRAHKSLGFRDRYWVMQQEAWRPALTEGLDPQAFDQVIPLFDWLKERMDDFILLSNRKPSGN